MKKSMFTSCLMSVLFLGLSFNMPMNASADQALRYSTSAQMFEAFENARLNTFTQDTGIAIDLFVASFQSCVYRLLQDMAVTLVVPGEDTGAHKNFRRQVMRRNDVHYDYMTYTSTRVLEAIESLPPGAVSFISRGAQITHPKVKVVQIDGRKPGDADYPFYQMFSLITKGEPAGTVKEFVDFTKSDKGKTLIIERGMLPVE